MAILLTASMSALEVKRTKIYGDLNFVTDLAKQFSLSIVGARRR
jgi:hypothetical protein